MDKFYVNCALREDINISCVKVTKKYYDARLKSCLSLLPLPVVKITTGCKCCYVQLRVASDLYKNNFSKYITYSEEKRLFEESENGGIPILFISEHYRNLLGIEIKHIVNNKDDLNFNENELSIDVPKNLMEYFLYILLAAYNHPELYSFFMFLIAIFGLILSIFSSKFELCSIPTVVLSCSLLIFALFIPTKRIGIGISLVLVCVSIILLFLQKNLPITLCGG